MDIYGQGRYTVTLKNKNKKEMYNLMSTISPLYFLFLFQNLSQIEDNIQSYQWATHWKDCLLR